MKHIFKIMILVGLMMIALAHIGRHFYPGGIPIGLKHATEMPDGMILKFNGKEWKYCDTNGGFAFDSLNSYGTRWEAAAAAWNRHDYLWQKEHEPKFTNAP